MEKNWVMTEEERLRMLRNRIERRKQEESSKTNRSEQKYEPEINDIKNYLSDEDVSDCIIIA